MRQYDRAEELYRQREILLKEALSHTEDPILEAASIVTVDRIEVHDADELTRALALGAELIGVNNRNLKTFKVDLATTEKLAEKIGAGKMLVAESGIHTRMDVERLKKCGAKAILVGESLMRGGDIQSKVRELIG